MRARVGEIELEYDIFGDAAATPLLLVMGMAYQMIEWDDAVCEILAGRGFRVIRFDNRDVGLSTHLDELGIPDLFGVIAGSAAPPYTLDDMAADATGLLDVLGIRAAHVVGVSMGGMIAQLMAINYPDRVLSLTSVMSTVGGPAVVPPEPAVNEALLAQPGRTREERVEHSLQLRRLINGAGLPFDEQRARRKAERAVDRSFHPQGAARQMAAILAAHDRVPGLQTVRVPALVIHGDSDPVVPPDNGRQTAAALPDARHMLIHGMGHNLPQRVWPQVVNAVVEVTGQVAPPSR